MFFSDNSKLKKSKAQVQNSIETNILYRRFTLIAINNFEWINLPPSIKPRYIETALFYNGCCAFANTKEYGYIVLPVAINGGLDLYYEPKGWSVIGNSFNQSFTNENSVLMRNNRFCIPSEFDVRWYSQKIADVQRTIDTNVGLHKMPFLLKGNSKQVLTMKTILNKINENELAVYVDDNVSSNMVDAIRTETPFIIDKLCDYKDKLTAEFYELYGYPTTQTEKAERLTMTESQVRVEFSDSGYVGAMFEYRKQACEEINKMFGLNIDVKINRYREKSEDYYLLEEMKLGQQGIKIDEDKKEKKEVNE